MINTMNAVFFIIIFISLLAVTFIDPESAMAVMLDGTKSALELSFKLVTIYAVWLSVLKIMEKTGLDRKLSSLFLPVTNYLFKGESEETRKIIGMNFAANMLGMGGAATPLGIKAMEKMDRQDGKASDNMIMLMVISSASIQILPVTIIALRSAGGSVSPSDIILPGLLSSAVTTLTGIILVKILSR